jgi:hypothetical protein
MTDRILRHAQRAVAPEPQPSMTPRYAVSQACVGMGKGNLITGLIVDHLQKYFSTAAGIEFEELRRHLWSPSEATGIVIAPVTAWTPETGTSRPAVLVRRNKFTKQRVTIGNRRQMQPANRQGFPHYTVVWGGTFTIFSLSTAALATEILATAVQRELLQFGPPLARSTGLMQFDVLDIDGIRALEEARQTFFVPVNVFVAYSESWIITDQSPPLRKISIDALLQR